MKKLKVITLLFVIAVLLSGCDFFRSMLNKPTSKDIEKMRIEEAQARKVAEETRRKAAEQEAIALAEAQRKLEEEKMKQDRLPKERYYLVYGSFRVESNAEKLYEQAKGMGLSPVRIKFKNGFDLVAFEAFDNIHEAYDRMNFWLSKEGTPDDIWVYDTHQNLHED